MNAYGFRRCPSCRGTACRAPPVDPWTNGFLRIHPPELKRERAASEKGGLASGMLRQPPVHYSAPPLESWISHSALFTYTFIHEQYQIWNGRMARRHR